MCWASALHSGEWQKHPTGRPEVLHLPEGRPFRNSGYRFGGEKHSYFELTYVDRGCMTSEVDEITYHLKERELMLYVQVFLK